MGRKMNGQKSNQLIQILKILPCVKRGKFLYQMSIKIIILKIQR